jgi:DNA-3-methyladenine glycosylase
MKALPRPFYLRDTKTVAQDLLGKRLCRKVGKQTLSGIIVETEAYLGLQDPACHSYHGKKTSRVEPLYKIGGTSYVYLIYGMYYCFNIATGDVDTPEAVLIRAIEPDPNSIETMKSLRPVKKDQDLTNGPGKLCGAFKIDKSLNGLDLTQKKTIWIEDTDTTKFKTVSTTRIGVDNYGECALWPLRFYIKDNPYISKK